MASDFYPDDEYKSRSQKKRESTALQKLGEELARLSPQLLRGLELPEDLRSALAELPRMKTHEARRRQMQYIGRQMREVEDPEALAEAVRLLQ